MRDIKKVKPGDPIRTHLTAHAWNSFIDGASGAISPPSGGVGEVDPNGARIWVENGTSQTLDRYSVVGIGAPKLGTSGNSLTQFLNKPLFAGETPVVNTHWNKPAILLETIFPGYIGQALVMGVIPVQVTIDHAAHTWADVQASTSSLKSYATGSCEILSPITQTGLQWCLVRMGIPFRGMLLGKANATFTVGTGTVNIYKADRTSAGYSVTAYCFVDITSTSVFLAVEEYDGVYYCSPLECQEE